MNEDWVEVLRARAALSSQRKVAEDLGVSPAMVNQVLRGTYAGNPESLRVKVEGRYMNHCVSCPVLGSIPVNECREQQERPFSSSNPLRVQLYRACRAGCPNSGLEATTKTQRLDVAPADERYALELRLEFLARQATSPEHHIELLTRELRQVANRLNGLLWDRKYDKRS